MRVLGFLRAVGVGGLAAALVSTEACSLSDPPPEREAAGEGGQSGDTGNSGGLGPLAGGAGRGGTAPSSGGTGGESGEGGTAVMPASGGSGARAGSGGSSAAGSGAVGSGGKAGTGGSGAEPGTGGTSAEAGGSAAGGTPGGNGGAAPATGGTDTSGGMAGNHAGSAGSAPDAFDCASEFEVHPGGYVTSPGASCWKGRAFITAGGVGTTIEPRELGTCRSDCSLCVSGSIVADADYSSFAMIGFLLNEDWSTEARSTAVPSGSALTITVSSAVESLLRVTIQGPGGNTNPEQRWCHTLPGGNGTFTIPYSAFNTECWSGEGNAYAGEPLNELFVIVPGSTTPVPYDFCLLDASDG